MGSFFTRVRSGVVSRLPRHIPVAYKLGAIISLLLVGSMALLGAVILEQQRALLRAQMDTFGHSAVVQLAESSKELVLADDGLALEALIVNLVGSGAVLGAAVQDRSGRVLARAGRVPAGTQALAPGADAAVYRESIRFRDMTLGTAMVTLSQAGERRAVAATLRSILFTTLAVSLLGGAAAFAVGRHLSRPLHRLVEATRAIGAGDYHHRLPEARRDELGHLMRAFNRMALGLQEKSQVEGALSRYVSDGVAREILSNLDRLGLGGRQVEASVVFADMAGFTRLAETLPPDRVAGLLNTYFTYVSHIARHYRGSIDKFMGDGVMLVFGVTEDDPDHRFHAIASGVMLQSLVARLNRLRQAAGEPPVQFRVGVNSGPMLAGNMGAEDRLQYTVVGDAVNLAARLMAAAGPGEVLAPRDLCRHGDVRHRVRVQAHRDIPVRGKAEPVPTCRVAGLAPTCRQAMEARLTRLLGEETAA
ncbi:adenylate/guanylate cyclase domain-containing protein [Ectothiorhodospira mobilis]|uniref:Adenylate cyclase n=1 Tax=Ectothiorhodospira mobilis TaxID=195064 RepID=A0A1I4P9M8_ECTMO|nr:adenylate/guanylate cyclase domain-containing protein [Ectothiorhodospira mobilis]MCG5535507.1 adenylate/guanylate cyclase domain-containing protein [Ectothiorhodospira mobilis]SFM24492.1 adenylate cyclase [Ectothiorhodospira mobilis]